MAVIEYMMHRVNGGTRRAVPEWVGDRGHLSSPVDGSLIGWVDDNRDYYVPDTVVTLTKADLVTRQLTIHASHPFMNVTENEDGTTTETPMTDAEVTTMTETWYDGFVAKNSV